MTRIDALRTLCMTLALCTLSACQRDEPQFRPEAREGQEAREADTRLAAAAREAEAAHEAYRAASQRPQGEPAAEQLPAPSDVAVAPADAARTSTGLASKVIQPGRGSAHPGPRDRVTVHYTGWTTDGSMFDSSVTRGEPATFPLDRVIPGWTEGVQLMVEGEKRRFWIPPNLAYEGRPGPQGMLVFDVELLQIID